MTPPDTAPLRFIDQPIVVEFKNEPPLEKSPRCPDGFIWDGEEYRIVEILSEWRDYSRRGRMARNMSDAHAGIARTKGSWGVGRFFFRIFTQEKRVFDIYYDRAPKDSADRKGHWFVYQELGITKTQ